MADERLLSRMGIAAQRQAIAGANVFAGVAGDQEASCREAIGLTNALPVIQRAGCSSTESCRPASHGRDHVNGGRHMIGMSAAVFR